MIADPLPFVSAGSLTQSASGVTVSPLPFVSAGSLTQSASGVTVSPLPFVPAGSLTQSANGVTVSPLPFVPAGSLTQSADGVTVSYPGGQYTLGILDHIRVCVTSKVSRAHGYSLTLQLLSCGPMPLRRLQYEEQKEKRKLVEVGALEAG